MLLPVLSNTELRVLRARMSKFVDRRVARAAKVPLPVRVPGRVPVAVRVQAVWVRVSLGVGGGGWGCVGGWGGGGGGRE